MFNLEELIVIIVRLLGALPVLKYAFIGSVLAVLIDLSDLFIISNLDLGGVKNYQNLDKKFELNSYENEIRSNIYNKMISKILIDLANLK